MELCTYAGLTSTQNPKEIRLWRPGTTSGSFDLPVGYVSLQQSPTTAQFSLEPRMGRCGLFRPVARRSGLMDFLRRPIFRQLTSVADILLKLTRQAAVNPRLLSMEPVTGWDTVSTRSRKMGFRDGRSSQVKILFSFASAPTARFMRWPMELFSRLHPTANSSGSSRWKKPSTSPARSPSAATELCMSLL